VDDITTSAYRNVVAEVEVEQSSSCHVRDVCAAEQNTLITATATTLQSGSYMYVTFGSTVTLNGTSLQQLVCQLRFARHANTGVAKFVSHRFYDTN